LRAEQLRDLLPRVPDVGGDLLFPGGAVGFVAYERGDLVEDLPPRPTFPEPNLWFGVYDTFALWRPEHEEVEVVSWGLTPEGSFDERAALGRARDLEARLRTAAPSEETAPRAPVRPRSVRMSLGPAGHEGRVREILEAIARGDIYQGNLTVRFDVEAAGDPLELFERLLRDNPAPYATFLEADDAVVVSCSPERLLAARGRTLESRPIKGTARRDPDPARDHALARELLASKKDRAELLMITDLVRNDLGKVCDYGTVRVPHLAELETYPHVHHLVSTIRGQLQPGRDVFDALEALFPGGSITGAPKRRAMEILRELEPCARGVYTGTVGWIGFDRSADLNIAIRSGMMRNGTFSFGAGGGIVADSDPTAEWEELILKAKAFSIALGVEKEALDGERIA
jgi:aminodeoxychorismate synthase component I